MPGPQRGGRSGAQCVSRFRGRDESHWWAIERETVHLDLHRSISSSNNICIHELEKGLTIKGQI